ncbi:hypothetical protein L195_g027701 [Trifolium pratense]|uniref:Uncharacterized protein n=1 Tax=Trifolium pratense TaxID=57577 RepID=A0A2K3KZU6_TRIPR|nr:hypothetical protein L195_g027701 [Trifolium pratense]
MVSFAVIWFRKSKRIVGSIYPKGLCGFLSVGLIPRSGFAEICWSQDVKSTFNLTPSSYSSQPLWLFGLLCSKELLCILLCSGSCWYVNPFRVGG